MRWLIVAMAVITALGVSDAGACTIGAQRYYINSTGQRVPSPTCGATQAFGLMTTAVPNSGITAICRDGSASHARQRRGACSGHGGVRTWVK